MKSDPSYGKLSHLKLDDLESGNRELRSQMDDDLKEDPADFAVWKAAKPGEPTRRMLCGMAAGIMLAASVWSLLLPAIERAEAGILPVWLAPAAVKICMRGTSPT